MVVDPNVKLHDSVTASRSGKDAEEAKYAIGQKVELLEDIVNDGTYPHAKIGSLMMPKGSIGYIKDMGEFLQVIRVYEVHFFGTEMEVDIIGCREHELKLIEDGYVSEDILEQEAMKAHREKMAKLNK
ncbi:nitrogen fixation protein NifZ [Candidatus Sulfurimonas marisnigri]|uniref:Nitrogen fixation protein NifZ n=1 Tax=Candidatus Sulfurimonas marisnigri TaxID=2740405 RepID=A0A7S7RRN2_9BACT|nr:nitrogen fixation protein NifZ [Candidatus Sulfurimonas marisnigri]